MRTERTILMVAAPLLLLAACSTSLSDQDRALLTSANQNAEQAKQQAAQANTTAQQALQTAQSADQKADRMFQHSLRK